jgi:hypothetical protein
VKGAKRGWLGRSTPGLSLWWCVCLIVGGAVAFVVFRSGVPRRFLVALGLVWVGVVGLLSRSGGKGPWRAVSLAALAVGLLGGVILLSYGMARPWVAHHDFNGAVYSGFARVIARHGVVETAGGQYWTGGSVFNDGAERYCHHPPGLSWLVALSFSVLGAREAAARLVPIACSLAGLAFWLVRLRATEGNACAGGALGVALACPGLIYFGRMVNFEPVIVGLALVFYAMLDCRPGTRWVSVLLVAMVAAMPLIGWLGIPTGVVAAWAYARRRLGARRRTAVLFCLIPLVTGLLVFGFNCLQPGGAAEMLRASRAWNPLFSEGGEREGVLSWLAGMGKNINRNVPWSLWFLPLALIVPAVRRGWGNAALWGTFIPGALMIAIMPRGALVHDYHALFLWPAAALLFGRLLAVVRKVPIATAALALVLAVSLQLGARAARTMHAGQVYAKHQAKIGLAVNEISEASDRLAVINTKGGPVPILTYYADRDFRLYPTVRRALHGPPFDYYVLVHRRDGVSDEEWDALLGVADLQAERPAPIFRRRADEGGTQ